MLKKSKICRSHQQVKKKQEKKSRKLVIDSHHFIASSKSLYIQQVKSIYLRSYHGHKNQIRLTEIIMSRNLCLQ